MPADVDGRAVIEILEGVPDGPSAGDELMSSADAPTTRPGPSASAAP